jgi:diguanylate cyclase (GGDEF)-like protein
MEFHPTPDRVFSALSPSWNDADERQVHVLIVKRDPSIVQAMLEAAEKPLGVHFQWTCVDGMESFPEQTSAGAFDVILLDLEVPGEDAFQAVHKARFFAPALPVVVLADADQKRNVPRGVRKEVDDILVRDQLTGVLLANSLHHVCERSRLQNALGSLPCDCRTGLYNRHFFSVMAEHYLRLAGRLSGVVVMYGILDEVHRINPPLFHMEERRMLLNTARILAKSFRESDLVAHWGRLEFAALAAGACEEHIPVLSARLKRNLDAFNMVTEPRLRLQLSFGFTAYSGESQHSIGELIGFADVERRRPSIKAAKTG